SVERDVLEGGGLRQAGVHDRALAVGASALNVELLGAEAAGDVGAGKPDQVELSAAVDDRLRGGAEPVGEAVDGEDAAADDAGEAGVGVGSGERNDAVAAGAESDAAGDVGGEGEACGACEFDVAAGAADGGDAAVV